MSVSGLVVTLADESAADQLLSALSSDARLTIGERCARRVAVVAETPDAPSDVALIEQLRHTPGIVNVDVAYVHWDQGANAAVEPRGDGSMEEHHGDR